ncbi:type II secretion system minor pseudopilin GspI [Wenzhouxiangella sp. EGI_FJ10409]|uniref:type II secretion system minor pseudopilin GspI n=1 Tax=Wenzhouxiangella sp. EGI_FJ10409 TaxID=3243767 RepID=UPI0035D95484
MKRSSGFTLLEVLVALVVVAVAVAALGRAGSQVLDSQADLERRTWALWVADNALAEVQLEVGVSSGQRQGSTDMGERTWYWEMLIEPAPGGELLRVDVAVFDSPRRDSPVIMHTGFLAP